MITIEQFRLALERQVVKFRRKPYRVRMPWQDRDALMLLAATRAGGEIPNGHDTFTMDGIEIAERRDP